MMRIVWMMLAVGTASAGEGLDAATAAVAELDAATVESFARAMPLHARNGSLRYTGPSLADPAAIPWLITRIADSDEDPLQRHAYAHALVRHLAAVEGASPWKDAWLELAASVDDRETRKQLVAGLAKADAETMAAGLGAALRHDDAELRALAANTAALHASGDRLAPTLLVGLGDADSAVRAECIRSLGVLKVRSASGDAARLTRDADGNVRMWALRTLQRLDAAAATDRAASMVDDTDPRVARFARVLAD